MDPQRDIYTPWWNLTNRYVQWRRNIWSRRYRFPRGIIFSIYAEAQKWKKVQIVAENGGTYWEVATERELHSKKVIELSQTNSWTSSYCNQLQVNLGWSNHQSHPHARFYVQSQKHLKAMKDGTQQTVPTPTMRFTTYQTVCTDLKLDDEYTSLKHEHVLFLLHLVRHGGWTPIILRVKTSGFTSPGCQQDQRQNCQGTVLWCEVGDRWYVYIWSYTHLDIYIRGILFVVYMMYLWYIDICLGCVPFRHVPRVT